MNTNRTILVVDDVPMFRELGSLFLASCGRVITAASGAEALASVHRHEPDIVVLDLHLGDMDGEAVCREIKSDPSTADIPVIVVTGNGNPGDHARAIRAGAEDVLSKPLSRTALVGTVNRFIRFATPRGLPRIDLDSPVRMVDDSGKEVWGTVRNLSRGGMFIESDQAIPRETELRLEFRLPESPAFLAPTAKVVWSRERWNGSTGGLGVRFLGLDRTLAENLDSYVYERAAPASKSAADASPEVMA